MTLAASVALLSAGIACFVALLCRLLSNAPGWREQRYFALVALSGAGYALMNIPTSAPAFSDATVVFCSRIQLAMAALHAGAWVRYAGAVDGRPWASLERTVAAALGVIALVGTVTPAMVPGGVRLHAFEPLGITYRTAVTSEAGGIAFVAILGALLVAASRLAGAWRRGVPAAGVQLAALAVLLAFGVNDALVAEGAYAAPYLGDIGFIVPAAVVGWALTARFVEDARAHHALRNDLQRQVAERTAELGRAQEALHRAEKLAALGQFAAGVAHEVNNPAAVVAANLQYLAENEAESLSAQAREAIDESSASVHRIAGIVRQLLDAGRLAASPEARTSVPLRALGDAALSVARARFGRRVRLSNDVAQDVHVAAQEGLLTQVLVNLVVNAVQAVPPHRSDGRVSVRAEQADGRVRLLVEDNGCGMDPEVLRRAFEPFFTTKPFGSGTGLGLAVSRGLVMSLGGDLRLESTPGEGTRAVVELEAAEPRRAAPRRTEDTPGIRMRLLVVDDEPHVRSSLRRVLEPRFEVDVASGVEDGLARMDQGRFDLVLCDVMMPGGGGERLYRSLVERAPALARRVVFFTGGAVTDQARRFLREQPQPVLPKPFDVDELVRLAEHPSAPR